MSGLTEVTAPTLAPVSIDELKDYLRIDGTDDDADVSMITNAARLAFEGPTNLQTINTTFDYTLDRFPWQGNPIIVPKAPLVSVTSITYTDSNGDSQTWASANYVADTSGTHHLGRISLAENVTYPETIGQANSVVVRFVAGFGAAPANVPEDIRMVIRRIACWMFEDRDLTQDDAINATFGRLIMPYRVWA